MFVAFSKSPGEEFEVKNDVLKKDHCSIPLEPQMWLYSNNNYNI